MDQQRLDYIDTLRAVAATSIVVLHLRTIATGGTLPTPKWLENFVYLVCGAGVPLFFVISAFLLCMLAPSYARSSRPLVVFYTKRFFRIAPLFYFAIVIWSINGAAAPTLRELLSNMTFTFNLIPELSESLIFAGWTIGVEMLFYLVFPFLYRVLPDILTKVAAFLVSVPVYAAFQTLVLSSGISPELQGRYLALTIVRYLPMFLLGMIAFDVYERLRHRREVRRVALALLAGSVAIFGVILGNKTTLIPGEYWQAAGAALALLAFSLRPMPGVNKVTAFLGRISYSTYLLHGLIIIKMGDVFHSIYGWGLPEPVSFALAVLLALAVIIPISALTYAVVEQPGNWLGTWIVRHALPSRQPQPAA